MRHSLHPTILDSSGLCSFQSAVWVVRVRRPLETNGQHFGYKIKIEVLVIVNLQELICLVTKLFVTKGNHNLTCSSSIW